MENEYCRMVVKCPAIIVKQMNDIAMETGTSEKEIYHMMLCLGMGMEHHPIVRKKRIEVSPRKKYVLKNPRGHHYRPSAVFLSSRTWKTLRFEVLKRDNYTCQACGRSPKLHGIALHVDHIKPRSKFPELALDIRNLQVLCEECNVGKWNR